jgi:formylglycine-generating enzyme required for sulfatase activity
MAAIRAIVAIPFLTSVLALAPSDKKPANKITNSLGMELVRIEPGEFVMGQGEAPPRDRKAWEGMDYDESPAHKVKITRPYYLAAHEITNAIYEQFDPAHRKLRGKYGSSTRDNDPVTHVTWGQAADFCAWLSKKEGKIYRLPTEAEWEFACRAGSRTLFYMGDSLTVKRSNFGWSTDGKRKQTTVAVGSYPANAWGLYDLHGNVAEWCADWFGPYEKKEQIDPVGPLDGGARVVRGGSFLGAQSRQQNPRFCRSANRSGHLPDDANRATGFRVALGPRPAGRPLPPVLPSHQSKVKQTAAPTKGPDPNKPYFVDFTKLGKNPTIPKDSWGPLFNHWNHYAAVCACPNGDVLMVWYTCVNESGRECAQAASRLRAGADRWDEASLFFGVPDVNCHAPVLLRHGKRIYHFANQALRGWDHAAIVQRISEDSGASWSKPRIIWSRDDPHPMSQPCSAFVSNSGALILALDGDLHKEERLLVSKDEGKTWQMAPGDLRVAARRSYVIHPAIFERADGAALAYLRGPDPMPVFVSHDLGKSWKMEATPFPGIKSGQKTAVLKLASGAIVLCSIDNGKKLVGGGTFAALSFDGGKTWPHVRKVEGVGGYMSLAQTDNGIIFLAGSRMGCAAFNEAWLKEGKAIRVR